MLNEPPAEETEAEIVPQDIVNLRDIASWVSREANLTPETEQALTAVLENNRDQLSAFMVAYARHEAKRSVQMLDYIESLQDKLMDPVRIERTDTRTLMNLLKTLGDQLGSMYDRIDRRIDGPTMRVTMTAGVDRSASFNIPELQEKESRERVRNAFDIALKLANRQPVEPPEIGEETEK
jgi:hypothetical protein